jgi:glycosyltransferase involved in cell wall biosynthesis
MRRVPSTIETVPHERYAHRRMEAPADDVNRRAAGAHREERSEADLAVLKSGRFGRAGSGREPLPYRMDHLRSHGYRLRWTDDHLDGAWAEGRRAGVVRWTERLAVPWLQTLLAFRHGRPDAVLAIFESEGHALGLLRSLLPRRLRRRTPPLVIVACWLTELVDAGGAVRLAAYRRIYRGVDRVVVLSENQIPVLVDRLGIPRERIRFVPFGVEVPPEDPPPVASTDRLVLAAGRDRSRDWTTLAAAASGSGWDVVLVSRPSQVEGVDLPPEVTFRGYVDHDEYEALVRTAGVVVVPVVPRQYPTGQTVLLEAMALGRACVVTDSEAMSAFVRDDDTAVLVPPFDARALRAAVDGLLDDPVRRARIGAAARADAVREGGAAVMWERIAAVIDEVVVVAEAPA